ncbi:TPA: restriction endonuclease [Legionella pneumophila]
MINFKELPKDGIRFEQLIRELLQSSGLKVHWTGVGQDGDRDLIAIESEKGPIDKFERTWLINCKHNAWSKKSVSVKDLSNIADACKSINAQGFLLTCSTQPTSSLVIRFKELSSQNDIIFNYWDSIELERRLFLPESFSLIHRFFPKSFQKIGWKIYNTFSPSLWAARYKDYFVYLSCRCAHVFPELKSVEEIFKIIEGISIPEKEVFEKHYIRPRAIYFDDKHGQFTVYLDYLISEADKHEIPNIKKRIQEALDNNKNLYLSEFNDYSNCLNWCLMIEVCDQYDDKFDIDHRSYYQPYIRYFQYGSQRDINDDFF